MSYKVITPLVALAAAAKSDDLGDANNGPRYFYEGAIIPDGYNDERCKELAKDGMLEKIKAAKAEPTGPNPGTAEFILNEVGDDKGKAQIALDEENGKETPRKTLVESLEKILAG